MRGRGGRGGEHGGVGVTPKVHVSGAREMVAIAAHERDLRRLGFMSCTLKI